MSLLASSAAVGLVENGNRGVASTAVFPTMCCAMYILSVYKLYAQALWADFLKFPSIATSPGPAQSAAQSEVTVPRLNFPLPAGSTESVDVPRLLKAVYAGRDQAEVAAHIAELEPLGVPAPTTTPALYPISPYLAQQTDRV